MFSLRMLKAFDLDRLHALFYQSQWEVVRESICYTIKAIFYDHSLIKQFNETSIVVIPKMDGTENIS